MYYHFDELELIYLLLHYITQQLHI